MMTDLRSLAKLLKALQQVPYVASKNIYRVGDYFLRMDQEKLEYFCAMLLEAKQNIVLCEICFCWKERDHGCTFCSSPKRDQGLICVVETWQELLAIEKTGGYTGVYHVLGGAVSPLEGISASDLTIEPLVARVHNGAREIILAMNQTPEGEATAAYIATKLKETSVVISCLARGIPVGSSLEFMDRLTVYKALSERRPF
jgi:recombination protein RecR